MALDDFSDSVARAVAARLGAQAGERRQQCRGCFSERASCGLALSATLRLAARTAAILVVFIAVRGLVVFHNVSALSLLRRLAGRCSDGAGRLVDGQ